MDLEQVKSMIYQLSPDERGEVLAFIQHLTRADDPAYRAELDRRMAAMDSGRKATADDVEDLHRELIRKGR